jgi:hypothetical protein
MDYWTDGRGDSSLPRQRRAGAQNDKVRNCKGVNPLKLQFIFNDPRHKCVG